MNVVVNVEHTRTTAASSRFFFNQRTRYLYNLPMAGFAIVMNVIAFGVVGLIVASVLAAVLYFLAKRHTPEGASNRWTVLTSSVAAPFLGLLWIVLAFAIHVFISHRFAHQDCGLGMSPDPFVTLPNGYTLGSHNTYDGYIQAPGFETGVPVAGPGYVRAIINLKLNGDNFAGTQFDFKTSKIVPFIFNARTHEYRVLPSAYSPISTSEDQKTDAWAVAMTSAHDDATSYWRMYEQNRHHWPEVVFWMLLLAGEFSILLWLRWIWR